MHLLILLLVIFYTAEAALLSQHAINSEWVTFAKQQDTNFTTAEESYRKRVFEKNLQRIEDHNERFRKGLESYKIGVNKFSVYSDDELQHYFTGLEESSEEPQPLVVIPSNSSSHSKARIFAPAALDWRQRGVITPVKDQQSCGSCWAFAPIAAIEAHYRIKYRKMVTLSEQQVVDCDRNSKGCGGGSNPKAYDYIKRNGGVNLDAYYRYESKQGTCRYNRLKPKVTIRGYASSLKEISENSLKNIVATKGPVSVGIHVTSKFAQYRSGVFYDPTCNPNYRNHAVTIIGYGRENGMDYWLVKNSWGARYGLGGYVKIARNRKNHCGIASTVSYPLL